MLKQVAQSKHIAFFAGLFTVEPLGFRVLQPQALREKRVPEFVTAVLAQDDKSKFEAALLLRELCAASYALPSEIPRSHDHVPCLDLDAHLHNEALSLVKECLAQGFAPPALAARQSTLVDFSLRAYGLALEAGLRGPFFLCHSKFGGESEALGVLNGLSDLVDIKTAKDPTLSSWKRGPVIRESFPDPLL